MSNILIWAVMLLVSKGPDNRVRIYINENLSRYLTLSWEGYFLKLRSMLKFLRLGKEIKLKKQNKVNSFLAKLWFPQFKINRDKDKLKQIFLKLLVLIIKII